jgi:hypothetical protein
MSKITFLVVVALVVGIAGGVIEVKWHADKLSALPGNLAKMAQDGSLWEKGRTLATSLKRQGEFWLIRDERQRLEIATNYISVDASRLNTLLEDKADPATILPQAELLTASIERAAKATSDSSVDIVASLQGETKQAFGEAAETVKRLTATHEDYKNLEQKFAGIVEKLEQQIGSIKDKVQTSEVAGIKDEGGDEATPTIPAIKLNF